MVEPHPRTDMAMAWEPLGTWKTSVEITAHLSMEVRRSEIMLEIYRGT
jgi:hypothetical protein